MCCPDFSSSFPASLLQHQEAWFLSQPIPLDPFKGIFWNVAQVLSTKKAVEGESAGIMLFILSFQSFLDRTSNRQWNCWLDSSPALQGGELKGGQLDKTLGPQHDKARITGTDISGATQRGPAFPLARAPGSQEPQAPTRSNCWGEPAQSGRRKLMFTGGIVSDSDPHSQKEIALNRTKNNLVVVVVVGMWSDFNKNRSKIVRAV